MRGTIATWTSSTPGQAVNPRDEIKLVQVILRYALGKGMVWLEELQWHFYAVCIMLVIMADQLNLSVGDLFMGAVIPGVIENPELVWFTVLVAVSLQTSFLTPPVGFAIFFLQGVVPSDVVLLDIYKGVVPFVILQLMGLGVVLLCPQLVIWLPAVAYG